MKNLEIDSVSDAETLSGAKLEPAFLELVRLERPHLVRDLEDEHIPTSTEEVFSTRTSEPFSIGKGFLVVQGLAESMGAAVSGRNHRDGGFEVALRFRGPAYA